MISVIWPDSGGIPASDRGLAYGDGLFETIRVDDGQAFLLDRHLNRLVCDAARLAMPVSMGDIGRAVSQALERLAPAESSWVLKVILTRGSGGRGYRPPLPASPCLVFSTHSLPPAPHASGVIAATSRFPLLVHPQLAGIKSLNRLQQVMASSELADDAFEHIMPDVDGNLIEGTKSNLLIAIGESWVTPAAESLAVAGVMRAEVLACLQEAGERIELRPVTSDDLKSKELRGAWITNSVSGVVPVSELNGRRLPLDQRLATIAPHGFLVEL